MFTIDAVVLYVKDLDKTEQFYSALFSTTGSRFSPTFLSFELSPHLSVHFKLASAVLPESEVTGGGGELVLATAGESELNNLFNEWIKWGVSVVQEPIYLPFGYTFVVADPDNHRIRVWCKSMHKSL
ncbi:glyoxalase [Vibrio sp.]|nr:glyoxalase [Vibrio sp.]